MLRGRIRSSARPGALTPLWGGTQERIVTGLPSYADLAREAT